VDIFHVPYKGVAPSVAAAGTPAAAIARLNSEINAVLAVPEVRERLSVAGIDVRGGTPEALGAEMRDDHARYGRIVQKFGIKAD
jgi:tripartite-type tricarboxylate transporter receptor subunit TctC